MRHNLELPPVYWADVRLEGTQPRGRDASERLTWEGRHHHAEADCRAVLAVMRRFVDPIQTRTVPNR